MRNVFCCANAVRRHWPNRTPPHQQHREATCCLPNFGNVFSYRNTSDVLSSPAYQLVKRAKTNIFYLLNDFRSCLNKRIFHSFLLLVSSRVYSFFLSVSRVLLALDCRFAEVVVGGGSDCVQHVDSPMGPGIYLFAQQLNIYGFWSYHQHLFHRDGKNNNPYRKRRGNFMYPSFLYPLYFKGFYVPFLLLRWSLVFSFNV